MMKTLKVVNMQRTINGDQRVDLLEDFRSRTSMYDVLKPFFAIGKYVGVFPLYEKSLSRFHWIYTGLSLAVQISAGCILAEQLIVMSGNARNRMEFFGDVTVNLTYVVLCPLLTIVAFSRRKRIKRLMATYMHGDIESKRKWLRRRALAIYSFLVLSVLCKVASWLYMMTLDSRHVGTRFNARFYVEHAPIHGMLLGVGMLIMTLSEFQTVVTFILLLLVLRSEFANLRRQLEKIRHVNNVDARVKSLAEAREAHMHMLGVAKGIQDLMSPTVLAVFVHYVVTVCMALFHMLDNIEQRPGLWGTSIALGLIMIYTFSMLTGLCVAADMAVSEATSVASAIFSPQLTDEVSCREEVKLLALQLHIHQVEFTASGFFKIDRSLAGTIIGFMITYSIVMVQLR